MYNNMNEYNKPRQIRPMSELVNPSLYLNEAEMTGRWYEDLQNYERNLDEMASTTLDQNFKEEMQHVDQWYRYLNEAEKTATMYTLLQHSTQVQARFFINLLQQMVKRDPLHSLLTPNNPDQDMQHHLAGAMAKAELEASQRLMSVLPYKTGQVISRPRTTTQQQQQRAAINNRHSFALGDNLDDYNNLFQMNNTDLLSATTRSPFSMNSRSRPHSVIEDDSGSSLFPNWNLQPPPQQQPRPLSGNIGHIGDRVERPKSADISQWNLPTYWNQPQQPQLDSNNDFASAYRRRSNMSRIPAVPETDERSNSNNAFYHSMQNIVDKTTHLVLDDNTSSKGAASTKDNKKAAAEAVDMELLKDVPAWLRSLRLHKYNPIFCNCTWQEMVKMSDEDLLAKGVAALGARRKMLKVFETIKAHCEENNIEY